jgi:hypothetical protein
MIVAVVAMRVMEVAVHQVVGVIAVGHGFVTAIRAVLVLGIVRATIVVGRAPVWICCVHRETVIVRVVLVWMVHVTVVQVVGVPIVSDGGMPTARSVHVGVLRRVLVVSHSDPPLSGGRRQRGYAKSIRVPKGWRARKGCGSAPRAGG